MSSAQRKKPCASRLKVSRTLGNKSRKFGPCARSTTNLAQPYIPIRDVQKRSRLGPTGRTAGYQLAMFGLTESMNESLKFHRRYELTPPTKARPQGGRRARARLLSGSKACRYFPPASTDNTPYWYAPPSPSLRAHKGSLCPDFDNLRW